MPDSTPIITKYRPITFGEVIGNTEIVKGLSDAVRGPNCPHGFLFTGPAGVGKTTLSRIIAAEIGASILEIDAASHSGIDDTRLLVEASGFTSITLQPNRLYIIDECFIPDSLVSTPDGKKEIKDLHSGDYILGMHGKDRIKQVFKNFVDTSRVIRLTLENNRYIITTKEHLFLTTEGWVEAERLSRKHILLKTYEGSSIWAKIPTSMLSMWDNLHDWSNRKASVLLRRMQIRKIQEDLSHMQRGIQFSTQQVNLFNELRLTTSNTETKGFASREEITENYCSKRGITKGQKRKSTEIKSDRSQIFSTDEGKQPFKESYNYGEDSIAAERKILAGSPRREWDSNRTSTTTEKTTELSGRVDGVPNTDSLSKGSVQIAPILLLSGSGSTGSKVSDRSRWPNTPREETTLDRLQEDRSFKYFGLEGIKSIERGSHVLTGRNCDVCTVDNTEYAIFYDLEIENHPSYTVEDVIVHNCHALSKQAWNPLLKLIEEPPPSVYIALCTTDPKNIPDTIKSRCHPIPLRSLKSAEIQDLIMVIAELEGWTLHNDIFMPMVMAAEGSARKALSILQACHLAQSREELSKMIVEVESDNDPSILLCKYLMSGRREWRQVQTYLSGIDDYDKAIQDVARYLTASLLRSEENQAHEIWLILQKFMNEVSWDKKVQFHSALGRILWGTIPF